MVFHITAMQYIKETHLQANNSGHRETLNLHFAYQGNTNFQIVKTFGFELAWDSLCI